MDDNYYKKGKDTQGKDQQSSTNGKSRTKRTNYNELGKGRIVESSQSGFAV